MTLFPATQYLLRFRSSKQKSTPALFSQQQFRTTALACDMPLLIYLIQGYNVSDASVRKLH